MLYLTVELAESLFRRTVREDHLPRPAIRAYPNNP